ncbi:MAG: NAD(P)-dependent oxidoreductase [Candidatus Korobacteraceae bacterium]
MKVLVLGATGSVGRLLVEEVLRRGYEVSALVRNPERLGPWKDRVKIVVGNALDPEAMERAVAGQDAVLYALAEKSPGQTTLFSETTRILLNAMEHNKVRRLVALTGVGSGETKGHGGFLYDRIYFPLFTRRIYEDKDRQEALIRKSSLEWIIVRAAVFREGKARSEFQAVTDVRGVTLRRIARREVAKFMVDQLTDDQFLGKTPFIGHTS